MMENAGKIVGTLIGVTLIGVGGVWIYRQIKAEERRTRMFEAMLYRNQNNDPATRIGGPRGNQPGIRKEPEPVNAT